MSFVQNPHPIVRAGDMGAAVVPGKAMQKIKPCLM